MKKVFTLLLALCLPMANASADDSVMVDYLQKLDKYYYNLSRDGLKSFQCNATAAFSGELPPGFQAAWKDFNWKNSQCAYDFSYLGGGVMPLLSFSSGGNDPQATPEKMRKACNLVNAFLELWGIFLTSPLYSQQRSGHSHQITRGADSTFSITEHAKNITYVIYFDAQSLATRFVGKSPKGQTDFKLGFVASPQGAVLKQMEMEITTKGGVHAIVDLFAQY